HSPLGIETGSTDVSGWHMSWLGSMVGGRTKPSDANPCMESICNRALGGAKKRSLCPLRAPSPSSEIAPTAWSPRQETATKDLSASDEAPEASPRCYAESELGFQEPPFRSDPI